MVTYKKAISEKWLEANNSEIDSLDKNKMWKIVDKMNTKGRTNESSGKRKTQHLKHDWSKRM